MAVQWCVPALMAVLVVVQALLALPVQGHPSWHHKLSDNINLNKAMDGFNPVKFNPYNRFNSEIMNPIFEAYEKLPDGSVVPNSFIVKARKAIKCDHELSQMVYLNYDQYANESINSYFSFVNGSEISHGNMHFDAAFGHDWNGNNQGRYMINFFKDGNGEIIQNGAICMTHDVHLVLYEAPVFTRAFLIALKQLNAAAGNPNSDSSRNIFKEFVDTYGTHFMKSIYFGAKLVFERRYPSRSPTAEASLARRRCVTEAALASIENRLRKNSSVVFTFSNIPSDCEKPVGNNAIKSESVVARGLFPSITFDDWAKTVEESPEPIHFELEKISNLFTYPWFDSIEFQDGSSHEPLNGTAMKSYFDEQVADYLQWTMENTVDIIEGGCDGFCPPGHECVENECVAKYGPVIIAGGFDGNSETQAVEVFGRTALPPLPRSVQGNSLTFVGVTVFSCGGTPHTDTFVCYILDVNATIPKWYNKLEMPISMPQHTAVTVASHIWMTRNGTIYYLDPSNYSLKKRDLPFSKSGRPCAVSNNTHSYMIGVGASNNEIWVNTVPSSPAVWHKVTVMSTARLDHACLWVGTEVYITGGAGRSSLVEVFDTAGKTVRQLESLITGRELHAMMVFHGKPAVVGGYGGEPGAHLDSIETYDATTSKWEQSSTMLQVARSNFGLLQLPD